MYSAAGNQHSIIAPARARAGEVSMSQCPTTPSSTFLLSTACCVLAACAALAARQAAPAVSAPVRVFTADQAARGEVVYRESCAACHGTGLTGGNAPALAGPAFARSWSDPRVTLDDMFFVIRTTMPPAGSTAIPVADKAAVFAYLLRQNGYEPGPTALTVDMPQMAKARVQVRAPAEVARPAPPAFVPGAAGASPASTGPDQSALDAASGSNDWLFHNHNYAGTRHSPLTEITSANAARLTPACIFQMGERDNFQTGPIVHDGVMYVTTMLTTIALDAATCRVRWRHTWEAKDETGWQRNRGVAIKDGRVVRATPDGYLLALSADRGAMLWARQVSKPDDGETFTMAPMIAGDLVLIGPAGSENNVQGWVGAFRLADGAPVWKFHTVPRPGEPGFETWKNPKQIPVGGGAVWTPFSLDVETGELHVAVTNPAPDLPIHLRQGDNLYTNSIVALDVRSGALKWYKQLIANDSHDWDVTHASPIFTATIDGQPRRLIATAGKDGMLRVLDRDSRRLVSESAITTRENADVPVGLTPIRACPGVLGGVEWNGPAFSPQTGLLYVPAVDWCTTFVAYEQVRHIPGKLYMGGDTTMDPPSKAQGWVTAVDAVTGEVRWRYRSARPMVAAVTTTASGVLFTGELTGDFLALDAVTGAVLYRFNTGGPMGGGIVTYSAGGRQYVAAVSGSPSSFWVDRNPGAPTIVVFTVPR
jgi:alcohol dehydrogenase (cytochrome c)